MSVRNHRRARVSHIKKRTPEQIAAVRVALSTLAKNPNVKDRAELDRLIDTLLVGDLARAERYEIANALGYQYPKKPPPKGDPKATDLNLWALATMAHGRREFPNKYRGDGSYLRRCVKAGLVEVVNKHRLRLTDAGFVALSDAVITGRWNGYVDSAGYNKIPDGPYTDEVFE